MANRIKKFCDKNYLRVKIYVATVLLTLITSFVISNFMFYNELKSVVERQYNGLYADMNHFMTKQEEHGSFAEIPSDFYDGYSMSGKMVAVNMQSDNSVEFSTTGIFKRDTLTTFQTQVMSLYIPFLLSNSEHDILNIPKDSHDSFSKMTFDENQRVYASVFKRFNGEGDRRDTVEIRKDITSQVQAPFRSYFSDFLFQMIFFCFVALGWVVYTLRLAYRPLEDALSDALEDQEQLRIETRVIDPKHGFEVAQIVNRFNDLLTRYDNLTKQNLNTMQDVSHEVKTHLTAIKQSVDVINLYGIEDSGILQQKLASIDMSINRATSIMSAILDLARLKQGALKKDHPSYKASYLLSYFLKFKRRKHQDFDIMLESHVGDAAIEIEREHFFLALNPIMDNATKYSVDSNTILVKAFNNEKQGTIHVAITNTGHTINPKDLPHLFERYYRGKNTGNVNMGSGLGLTITKEVMDIYNGTIKVKSDDKGRTTFTLIFPRSARPGLTE